ncbi:uncharacterized protein E0L32_010052 [Thyridium curvatum]|uniref:Uncharacterized protein n=1 Tax=Thyridium curvatum TaxID=1093900 RepID=A0A507AFQ6_9PEZI|nr:uncharacterized protein E0L32_010052 [Thyridium curvatum]TPX08435.1 hypothetical protein E0L32_010052 [Thyridium curvatum]
MASQQGKWREDQILIICPGSQTTMAQLGCAELTPPAFRFPTRMFKDDESDDWRPYHTFKRKKASALAAAPASSAAPADADKKAEDEWEYVEDPDSTEGAVYPMQAGRIVNMDAFLAFLDHVHSMLTTTYHNTPIMLMASPQWTRPDCEMIARYIFEKTKTPALCLIHSGIATQYGLKWPHMTVVDIGFEKVDITCIFDSRVVSHEDVGDTTEGENRQAISGGEVFTRRLMKLLQGKDFNHEMAEQLKRSAICEVLPYAADKKGLMELPSETASSTAAPVPAPSAVLQAAQEQPNIAEHQFQPAVSGEGDDAANGEGKDGAEDGVLDVASIVTSGQTKEFLAKKEKEKAEKVKTGKRGKDKDADAAAAKPARLPNAKRVRNTFHFEQLVQEDKTRPKEEGHKEAGSKEGEAKGAESKDQEMKDAPSGEAAPAAGPGPATTETSEAPKAEGSTENAPATNGEAPKSEATAESAPANGAPTESAPAQAEPPKADKPDEPLSFFPSGEPTTSAPAPAPEPERQIKRIRKDIEIGLERFVFADRAEIDRIVTAIYRAVQGIEDMYMRPQCWENIVFVGNGGRIRGLKDNIIQTLTARHLISPSTATMFTSELPSNLGTPTGTGSQTPTGSFTGAPHQLPTSSSVNPLLQAATTASLQGGGLGTPGPAGSNAGGDAGPAGGSHSHHFHSQTPTAIKLAPLPTYLSEWSKNGFEEAMFLGAQVAARLAFCVHNLDAQGLEAQRMMSLGRVDYK